MGHAKQDAAAVEPVTVTLQTAARLTGVSPDTLYRWIADKSLKSTKIRGRRLVVYSSLMKLVVPDATP